VNAKSAIARCFPSVDARLSQVPVPPGSGFFRRPPPASSQEMAREWRWRTRAEQLRGAPRPVEDCCEERRLERESLRLGAHLQLLPRRRRTPDRPGHGGPGFRTLPRPAPADVDDPLDGDASSVRIAPDLGGWGSRAGWEGIPRSIHHRYVQHDGTERQGRGHQEGNARRHRGEPGALPRRGLAEEDRPREAIGGRHEEALHGAVRQGR
jgi:hypothetical protein